MHGYNYRYELDENRGTIKLKPTKGTIAKALAPVFVIWGAIGFMSVYAKIEDVRAERKLEKMHRNTIK